MDIFGNNFKKKYLCQRDKTIIIIGKKISPLVENYKYSLDLALKIINHIFLNWCLNVK